MMEMGPPGAITRMSKADPDWGSLDKALHRRWVSSFMISWCTQRDVALES
jgi:hypothetical protein